MQMIKNLGSDKDNIELIVCVPRNFFDLSLALRLFDVCYYVLAVCSQIFCVYFSYSSITKKNHIILIKLYYTHALDEWIVKFRHQSWKINPLSANPTNWSNTLKQLVGCCWRTVWVCLTILWDWHLKGQHKTSEFYTHFPRVHISVSHNSYVFLWTYENGFSEVFRVCENEIHEPLPKTPKNFL